MSFSVMKDIIYAIFDRMSILDISIFGQSNKTIYQLAESNEYWCRRSHRDGLISTYQRHPHIESPKLRYAWSTLKVSLNVNLFNIDLLTFVVSKIDKIHFSQEDYSLVCNLIGLRQAILLAARKDDIDLAIYVVSLGLCPYMIKHAIILALDMNHKDFACNLSEVSDLWDHYEAKYDPDRGPISDLHDYMFGLARYGHFHQLLALTDDDYGIDDVESLKIFYYLTGLVMANKHDLFLFELEENMPFLAHSPMWYYVTMFREIIKSGTVRLLIKVIDIISGIKNISSTEFISDGDVCGNLISTAQEEDRVDIMRYLVLSIDKESKILPTMIKSREMFDLLRRKIPRSWYDLLNRGVMRGHNYRLLSISLEMDDWEKVSCCMDVTPFMLKVAIHECRGKGRDVGEDLVYSVRMYYVDGFIYNFIRSMGHEINLDVNKMKKWISRARIGEEVDLDHLPYLKADLGK